MPLRNFGVLKGKVVGKDYDKDDRPHLHLLLEAAGEKFDASVNVKSSVNFSTVDRPGVPKNQVLFLISDPYTHPLLEKIADLDEGFHEVESKPNGISVDYIRGNFFDPANMQPLVHDRPGEDNDLFDKIGLYVNRAMNHPDCDLYVFGEPWPKNDRPNRIFGFTPDQGIHDVHMNQGNDPNHTRDDGVWQDGCMFFRFGESWVGIFLAFQSQCWHTDDASGSAIAGACARPAENPNSSTGSDKSVVIVGATVNPRGEDKGLEAIYLLNKTPAVLNLQGWSILDKAKRAEPLHGLIKGNDMRIIYLKGDTCQLGNGGGIITLLDNNGLKVHGVAYTGDQVKAGLTLTF